MPLLDRYISRLMLSRFVFSLVGFVVFVLSLDLVLNAGEAIEKSGGDSGVIVDYALLRLPEIFSQLLAIALLISTLAVLTQLIRNSELVAFWNCGRSPLTTMAGLLPICILVGGLQFLNDDLLVPASVARLNDWGVGDYGKGLRDKVRKGPLWLRTGGDILRLPSASIEDGPVKDVIIFRRDDQHQLSEWIAAGQAEYGEGGWLLRDVTIYPANGNKARQLETLTWETSLALDSLTASLTHPSELPFHVLGGFLDGTSYGLWPAFLYRTWYHERLAAAITPYLIVVLLFLLAQRFQRGGGLGLLYLNAIGFGFGYFVLDRAALALGEAALLPATVAAWSPSFILAMIAASYGFSQESHAGLLRSLRLQRLQREDEATG